MKKGLIVFALVLLLTVAAVAGYEIYMNTREYTIDDLNGIWTCELDSGSHCVLYIHDGRMDLMVYEKTNEKETSGFDTYRAMVMEPIPEGSFNKVSWTGTFDLERTGSQSSTYGLLNRDGYEFEFKKNRIYQRGFLTGGELKYVRGTEEEHPHVVRMSKALDQAYQLSLSQKPLEIGELHCYSIVGAAKDGYYDSFLCIRITNSQFVPYRLGVCDIAMGGIFKRNRGYAEFYPGGFHRSLCREDVLQGYVWGREHY